MATSNYFAWVLKSSGEGGSINICRPQTAWFILLQFSIDTRHTRWSSWDRNLADFTPTLIIYMLMHLIQRRNIHNSTYKSTYKRTLIYLYASMDWNIMYLHHSNKDSILKYKLILFTCAHTQYHNHYDVRRVSWFSLGINHTVHRTVTNKDIYL